MPPMDSVTQVGSPENRASYSGVRRNRTMRSLMTKSSISSCANSSVIAPEARSRCRYTSRKVETRPSDMAAPFCSFTAPR
jgi:hypothetical protein